MVDVIMFRRVPPCWKRDTVDTRDHGQTVGVGGKAWPEPRAGRLRAKLWLLGWQGRKHLPVPRWVGAEHLES